MMTLFKVQTPCPKCGSFERTANAGSLISHCAGCKNEFITVTGQDILFLRACELGCTPVMGDGGWECRCRPEAVHGVTPNYPALSTGSLKRVEKDVKSETPLSK